MEKEEVKTLFIEHASNWKNDTKYLSSLESITDNISCKKIIEIGKPAIELIVQEIKNGETNYCWFYILYQIIGKNPPANEFITCEQINRYWVRWIEENKII